MDKALTSEGEIYRSEFFVVTRERGGRVIRLRRTSAAMTLEGLMEIQRWFERLFPAFVRPRYALLLDTRDAPMSQDPALEKHIYEVGARLFASFARRAVLVETAAGKLQTARINRSRGQPVPVFDDDEEVLDFLLDAVPNSPR
jgi:hypothetical protein